MLSGFLYIRSAEMFVQMRYIRPVCAVFLFLFPLACTGFDEDWDNPMAWDVDHSAWFMPSDTENSSAGLSDFAATWAYQNVTLSPRKPSVIDLVFEQQEVDMFNKLNTMFSNLFGVQNATADGPWTFVSVVTLMPLRCADVERVVSLFDNALQQENPAADISSVAQKLGAEPCNGGICPCLETRRHSVRALEIRSTSKQRTISYPANFPYPVRQSSTSLALV